MRTALLMLAACTPAAPDTLLAVSGEAGDYELQEVQIPELDDPYRMRGALGDGRVGGFLRQLDNQTLEYTGGGGLAVDYLVNDGVGVPVDADGIALWSYYNTLSNTRTQLDALDRNVDHIFPIDFAFQPSVGGMGLTTSNAAYVSGGAHLFALLADPVGAELPLAANPMVIRHEFGHALFQDIVAGGNDVYDESIVLDNRIGALNEGFADILASLLLDDPDILGASFGDVVARPRLLTGAADANSAAPLSEDIYGRGTVYASFAWDLRLITGDPERTLQHAITALERFAATGIWRDTLSSDLAAVDSFSSLMLEEVVMDDPDTRTDACAAYSLRFPTHRVPSPCSL